MLAAFGKIPFYRPARAASRKPGGTMAPKKKEEAVVEEEPEEKVDPTSPKFERAKLRDQNQRRFQRS